MEQICIGFSMLKSYGAIAVSMHGIYAHITFKSAFDACGFVEQTRGAIMDSELTVRVNLNEYLKMS